MKKTLIDRIPMWLPEEIGQLCEGAKIYDSSCSPEARVYFIDREGGYYLKVGKAGSLKREAMMTEYFHKKRISTELLSYISSENDIMLTNAVVGDDCTTAKYLDEPTRLADIMAERLRMLHEIDVADCPVRDRIREYISLAENNYKEKNYNTDHFPDSFGYASAEEAFATLTEGRSLLKNEVLIHGDYCLPNIMLNGWNFSGFIDLGNSGIGDRHIDIFWGRWSLGFNLSMQGVQQTEKYCERFLDAYGRDKIDNDALRVVAAAEVFG